MAQHCSTCSTTWCATQTPRLYRSPRPHLRRNGVAPIAHRGCSKPPTDDLCLWTTYTAPIKPPSKNHSQNVSKAQRLRTSLAPAKTATPARRRNRQASLCFSETHRVSEKHVPGRRLGGPRGPAPGGLIPYLSAVRCLPSLFRRTLSSPSGSGAALQASDGNNILRMQATDGNNIFPFLATLSWRFRLCGAVALFVFAFGLSVCAAIRLCCFVLFRRSFF